MMFDLKRKVDGSIEKYKVRLVVRGFKGGHVNDVCAPVVDF